MSERLHATYQTATAPVLDAEGRLMPHAWVESEPARVALAVQWDAGDEEAAIAELTRAYDATLKDLTAAVVARLQAVAS